MSMCERALTPATLLGRTNCCSGHRIGTLQFLPSNIVSAYIHFTKYIGYVYPVCYLTLFACLFDFTNKRRISNNSAVYSEECIGHRPINSIFLGLWYRQLRRLYVLWYGQNGDKLKQRQAKTATPKRRQIVLTKTATN